MVQSTHWYDIINCNKLTNDQTLYVLHITYYIDIEPTKHLNFHKRALTIWSRINTGKLSVIGVKQ